MQPRAAESNIVRLITLFIFLYRCGVCWLQDHVCLDCSECGGYSLQRPCPLCDGRCASPWKRDLTLVSTIQHLQCTHIHAVRTYHQLMSCPNCFETCCENHKLDININSGDIMGLHPVQNGGCTHSRIKMFKLQYSDVTK